MSCKERIRNMILNDIERMTPLEELSSEDTNLLKSLYGHSIVQNDPYLKSKVQNILCRTNMGTIHIYFFLEDDNGLETEFLRTLDAFFKEYLEG